MTESTKAPAPQATQTPPPAGSTLRALLEAMRPAHWVKNLFVLAPLLFSGKFGELGAWLEALVAFSAFCLLSSAVYLINDIHDADLDRLHPSKRNRPIASGRLLPSNAVGGVFLLLLLAGGFTIGLALAGPDNSAGVLVWTLAYLALNLAYSFVLKAHVIVDVLAVAMGFVFRAMAGAAAIRVPVSPWLVVCSFTLCLFIAMTKRRNEIQELDATTAGSVRHANRGYTHQLVSHMLTVSTAMAAITYSLYCLAERTIHHFGSAHMVWTIPLVIYGMFRFNLISSRGGGGDPVRLLLADKIMWLVVSMYVLLTALIWQIGRWPEVSTVLDF